ncbi:hypothetical protein C0J52_22600, partial [Blattella germanica]
VLTFSVKNYKCTISFLKGGPQDNLNALQRAIDSMEEKGLQEDPRYSQLLALRARQGSMEPPRTVQIRRLATDQKSAWPDHSHEVAVFIDVSYDLASFQ